MTPLATADELQTHLGRLLDETQAQQALEFASGAVRSYCHWQLSYVADAGMQVYGDGSKILTLPTLWLADVHQITVNGVDVDPVTVLWDRKGQIRNDLGWAKDAIVDLIVDHGYDPIPDAVKLVTCDAAVRQIINPEALVGARVGEVQRTWSSASGAQGTLTTLHQALLDNYRLFT